MFRSRSELNRNLCQKDVVMSVVYSVNKSTDLTGPGGLGMCCYSCQCKQNDTNTSNHHTVDPFRWSGPFCHILHMDSAVGQGFGLIYPLRSNMVCMRLLLGFVSSSLLRVGFPDCHRPMEKRAVSA